MGIVLFMSLSKDLSIGLIKVIHYTLQDLQDLQIIKSLLHFIVLDLIQYIIIKSKRLTA
jgi:hypothetical protein